MDLLHGKGKVQALVVSLNASNHKEFFFMVNPYNMFTLARKNYLPLEFGTVIASIISCANRTCFWFT